jgi:hypothetical protein
MKPVEMRHHSDCVAACLAALFELPIDDVPNFWVGEAAAQAGSISVFVAGAPGAATTGTTRPSAATTARS